VIPSEFKTRFIASLPEIPDDVDLSLDEFASFPPEQVGNLRISDADKRLLIECGLPADASPFLSFGLTANRVLMPLAEFPHSVAIGHNGSGDMICIDQSTGGAIVYYNHDNHMQRVFMNSSLMQFAECLCLFAEFMQTKDSTSFTRKVFAVDPAALAPQAFWPNEVQCEIES
jgi:hypothetical protein